MKSNLTADNVTTFRKILTLDVFPTEIKCHVLRTTYHPPTSTEFVLLWSSSLLLHYFTVAFRLTASICEPRHDKTNKMSVRPAKTQISLGIRPIWSESSLCAQWVAKDPSFLHADSEDWSDWADAQADLSLCWAHSHFVGFVMSRLMYVNSVGLPSL